MSDETLIRYGAPTLAAIKTGSLFNCPFSSREEMNASLRAVNKCLLQKGVCVLPLRYKDGKALVYLYRPLMLEQDLRDPVALDILREAGYPGGKPGACIGWLIRRLKEYDTFPHEIGLFLGYPAVDVRGFIRHREPLRGAGAAQRLTCSAERKDGTCRGWQSGRDSFHTVKPKGWKGRKLHE